MIVNKSMFPLQTGFSVISKMQDKFATLQMQLGTGQKAQTLADMGRDLPVSLSVRSRLSTIEGYTANIEQVNLRLSFLDNALSRFDKIEGEARNSSVPGQYGTNNINMATAPELSKSRLDEVVTMLNGDIAGRYIFGGKVTDKAPLPTTAELLDGAGGRAGFKTVVNERKAADAGSDGFGRLDTAIDTTDPLSVVVNLAEDGNHPFGFKLSTISTVGTGIGNNADFNSSPAKIDFTFTTPPAAGDSVTLGFTLPDGTETQITLRAVTTAKSPPAADEFVIGADASATAGAFKAALEGSLQKSTASEMAAASTFAASENFFNAAGEPVLRVAGNDPFNATALRVASKTDTVMWYSGESPAIFATGMGRLTSERNGAVVTLSENVPVSQQHGFQITNATATSANAGGVSRALTSGDPANVAVNFGATAAAGDKVTLTLSEPGGKQREITLTAVAGTAGPGQFSLGATPEATAENFNKAMQRSITEAATDAQGNPRQSVSSAIEDAGRVNYGMQANEAGYLRMVRSLASMSVETYPELAGTSDPNSADLYPAKARFDAMAARQQSQLSEGRNNEKGSIELVTMELGIARASLESAGKRHQNYKSQLDNLLSDVETVSKEDVAMEILALQTRLTASYQVTSMVSQLSLVNFLR
ncbi:hypothetical protein [Devosia rhizoryzae]|uniref:Flagellin N-terminal domain-containing protein n=1 Tax=Devosia rhizoryzae TaxID=2774137 RepID=A0ABX7C826_9HYPH|nr:hypothetical protein [Devosia rhizoryzae]QQR40266.1 hypothetical protein JI748_04440 [Devosia rhizoryzae]